MKQIVYCGSIAAVAEYICMSDDLELKGIICEKQKTNSELLTVSVLRGVDLVFVNNYADLSAAIGKLHPEVILLVCSLGLIIKKDILEKRKVFNIHTGTLPDYKGRHPTFYATVQGEKHLGVTLHEMNAGIDTGDIVFIEKIPYYYWMSEPEIFEAMVHKVPLLLQKLVSFLNHEIQSFKNEGGYYFPPVSEAAKTVNRNDEPAVILNKIRAQNKYEGARLSFRGEIYGIKRARVDVLTSEFVIEQGFFVLLNDKLMGLQISPIYYIKFLEFQLL